MIKRKDFYFLIICLLVLFLFFVASHVKYNSDEAILVKEKQVTFGNIIDYGKSAGRGGHSAKYKFKVHSIEYIGRFTEENFCFNPRIGDKMKISKIKIPIVYLPDNPRVSRIILNKEDYEKYDIPYLDTLPDILVKYFECES